MSKKLLEESTIRSFMKLANLQPLTAKFLKESEEESEEDSEEVDESLEEGDGQVPFAAKDKRPDERDAHADVTSESLEEEAEVQEEGKESEGRPASPKQKVAGVAKPGKMAAAKNAAGDAKLKPAQKTTHHSDKPDSVETKGHSNASKKNNSQFEIVTESLEEEMGEEELEAPEAGEEGVPSDVAGEGGDHQAKMKELIRGMLSTLKDMGAEYGMSMEISDESEAGAESEVPEAPEAGGEEEMMEAKLDEMVEKLTKRVASRLVKESKKH